MRCITLTACAMVLVGGLCLAPPAASGAPAQLSNDNPDIEAMINALADPSPAAREQAKQRLVAMGARARAALVDAWRADDPRIGPIAGEILLKLPWAVPEDPPGVRRLLSGYGEQDEDKRREIVQKLRREDGGSPAMIRLLEQDPSERVSWTILSILRRRPDDEMFARLRQIKVTAADGSPAPARPQALAAAAVGWLPQDWPRGVALLRRAVDRATDGGGGDEGALAFAYDVLVGDAIAHQHYDDAADLRRTEAVNTPVQPFDDDAPRPVLDLFALHADYGPLAGFTDDLADYADQMGRPEIMYAMARAHDRAGHGLLAMAIRHVACSASLIQPDAHLRIASFLQDRNWHTDTERELAAVTACGNSLDPARKAAYDLSAEYFLGELANDRGDDAAAATHFQLAQDAADRSGREARPGEFDLRARVHSHRLRAARAAHDDAAAARELKELLAILNSSIGAPAPNPQGEMFGTDADSVIEAASYLRATKRDDDAHQLFTRVYQQELRRFGGKAETPEQLNNLAWLCARCDERPDEAVKVSRRAVAAAPETGGYWDTAAEAAFKAGDAASAVQYEERALTLKPHDRFILKQLDRFRGGKPSP